MHKHLAYILSLSTVTVLSPGGMETVLRAPPGKSQTMDELPQAQPELWMHTLIVCSRTPGTCSTNPEAGPSPVSDNPGIAGYCSQKPWFTRQKFYYQILKILGRGGCGGGCGGLDVNGSVGLYVKNTWFPREWNCLGRMRKCGMALLAKVCHMRSAFRFQKATSGPVLNSVPVPQRS